MLLEPVAAVETGIDGVGARRAVPYDIKKSMRLVSAEQISARWADQV